MAGRMGEHPDVPADRVPAKHERRWLDGQIWIHSPVPPGLGPPGNDAYGTYLLGRRILDPYATQGRLVVLHLSGVERVLGTLVVPIYVVVVGVLVSVRQRILNPEPDRLSPEIQVPGKSVVRWADRGVHVIRPEPPCFHVIFASVVGKRGILVGTELTGGPKPGPACHSGAVLRRDGVPGVVRQVIVRITT